MSKKRPSKIPAKASPPAKPAAPGLNRTVVLSVLLAAVTLAVFWPAHGFDFINCDDPEYFTHNPHVQAGLNWAQVKWAFTTVYFGNWLPLTWVSLMLDVQCFGSGPAAPHMMNVLLHTANALLVFLVLRRMTGAQWRSLAVAGLFALHPLHVESVAWVAERRDVLSAFFGLLSLLCYACYAKPASGNRQLAIANYSLALFFIACSLMSKATLVTMPFALLLLDYWPLNRVSGSSTQNSKFNTPNFWRLTLEKLPFLFFAAVSSGVTYLAQQKVGAMSGFSQIPAAARIENAFVAYGRYLGKTFWPGNLALPYPIPGHWPAGLLAGTVLLVTGLTVAAVWLFKRQPYVTVGWFWFLGMLVPMIGLVQVGAQAMADRFSYIPLLGIFWALVWGAGALVTAGRLPKATAVGVTILALGACAFQTRVQLGYWRDGGTLFQHAVAVVPDNYLADSYLGAWLAAQGRTDEAIALYRAALSINPDHEQALNNLGNALVKQGDVAGGIECFQKALQLLPASPEVHNNLGNALARQGKFGEAEEQFHQAIKSDPDFSEAHNDLGNLLATEGRFPAAEAEFHEAIRCQPKSADARFNLGNALALQGKFLDAIQQYAEALRLKPDYAQAQLNWGSALVRLGRKDEAVEHLREALRLKPDYEEARQRLKEIDPTASP